jgi:hypothetical protein
MTAATSTSVRQNVHVCSHSVVAEVLWEGTFSVRFRLLSKLCWRVAAVTLRHGWSAEIESKFSGLSAPIIWYNTLQNVRGARDSREAFSGVAKDDQIIKLAWNPARRASGLVIHNTRTSYARTAHIVCIIKALTMEPSTSFFTLQ